MCEAGIWTAVILIGLLAVALREYARTSGTFAARLEQVKVAVMTGAIILLGVTAAVLAVGFIIAVVIVEIWRPLVVVLAVFAGLVASVIWLNRPRA